MKKKKDAIRARPKKQKHPHFLSTFFRVFPTLFLVRLFLVGHGGGMRTEAAAVGKKEGAAAAVAAQEARAPLCLASA